MATREHDWWQQAQRDLEVARGQLDARYYEWACFAAHQAVEKAVKALYQHLGASARGHDLQSLFQGLAGHLVVPEELLDHVAELDKHYIASRYPDAFVEGTPAGHYTLSEARRAVQYAESVLRFCGDHLA